MYSNDIFNVSYNASITVQNVVYTLLIVFSNIIDECKDVINTEISEIVQLVAEQAIALGIPESFRVSLVTTLGTVQVSVTKHLSHVKWETETALNRMIAEGRLIQVGDRLRLTNQFTIGDLDRYGITKQYLVNLGYIETITGKSLTIANLSYHLKK